MKHWFLAFIFRLPFTIDRIEGQWVIVEWANMALTTIWEGHFPTIPIEGRMGMLTLWICQKSNTAIINNAPLLIQEKDNVSMIPYSIPDHLHNNICIDFEYDPNSNGEFETSSYIHRR